MRARAGRVVVVVWWWCGVDRSALRNKVASVTIEGAVKCT